MTRNQVRNWLRSILNWTSGVLQRWSEILGNRADRIKVDYFAEEFLRRVRTLPHYHFEILETYEPLQEDDYLNSNSPKAKSAGAGQVVLRDILYPNSVMVSHVVIGGAWPPGTLSPTQARALEGDEG